MNKPDWTLLQNKWIVCYSLQHHPDALSLTTSEIFPCMQSSHFKPHPTSTRIPLLHSHPLTLQKLTLQLDNTHYKLQLIAQDQDILLGIWHINRLKRGAEITLQGVARSKAMLTQYLQGSQSQPSERALIPRDPE